MASPVIDHATSSANPPKIKSSSIRNVCISIVFSFLFLPFFLDISSKTNIDSFLTLYISITIVSILII